MPILIQSTEKRLSVISVLSDDMPGPHKLPRFPPLSVVTTRCSWQFTWSLWSSNHLWPQGNPAQPKAGDNPLLHVLPGKACQTAILGQRRQTSHGGITKKVSSRVNWKQKIRTNHKNQSNHPSNPVTQQCASTDCLWDRRRFSRIPVNYLTDHKVKITNLQQTHSLNTESLFSVMHLAKNGNF